MGKYEKGTPKEIANRCKSKGLQKLRWWCQMCKKQCRDQNGFKCHLTSETHQRQLLLFAENPDSYLKEFSVEFERNFLNTLRSTFGTKRVRANEVYQEYIKDKQHTHMNSTEWQTLTNFVNYLGKSGKCHIDLTEKGWYIAWIDQEEELRKQQAMHKVKAARDDDERQRQLLEEQAIRARKILQSSGEGATTSRASELIRAGDDEKIAFSLDLKKPASKDLSRPTPSTIALSRAIFDSKLKKEMLAVVGKRRRSEERELSEDKKVRRTALDEIREMEERRKEKQNRRDHWLHEGIVVKIMSKKYGNEFYKAKCVVKCVEDEYVAVVAIGETVIPAIGRRMLVVNGAYRNTKAVLEEINEKKFSVVLRIDEGFAKGRVITLPYEDASKLHE